MPQATKKDGETEKAKKPTTRTSKRTKATDKTTSDEPTPAASSATPTATIEQAPPVAAQMQDEPVPDGICATCKTNPTQGKHKHCPVCYQQWLKENQTMVPCGTCKQPTVQHVYPDGQKAAVTYCTDCRAAYRAKQGSTTETATSTPAEKPKPTKPTAQQQPSKTAREMRQECKERLAEIKVLRPMLSALFPTVDFTSIDQVIAEGEVAFTSAWYNPSLAKLAKAIGDMMAIRSTYRLANEDLPDVLSAVLDIAGPFLTDPTKFGVAVRDEVDSVKTWTDAEAVAKLVIDHGPLAAMPYLNTRLDNAERAIDRLNEMIDNRETLDEEIAKMPVEQLLEQLDNRYNQGRIHRSTQRRERRRHDDQDDD